MNCLVKSWRPTSLKTCRVESSVNMGSSEHVMAFLGSSISKQKLGLETQIVAESAYEEIKTSKTVARARRRLRALSAAHPKGWSFPGHLHKINTPCMCTSRAFPAHPTCYLTAFLVLLSASCFPSYANLMVSLASCLRSPHSTLLSYHSEVARYEDALLIWTGLSHPSSLALGHSLPGPVTAHGRCKHCSAGS